ncbi:MAG: DUF4159 domain-containing protein [Spirochaetes bacterium]|nr:DUF4159 domain-containing protein [Spirochaetota bacterium]
MKNIGIIICLMYSIAACMAAEYDFRFAVLKYDGGGDWYEAKVGVINLMKALREASPMNPAPEPSVVSARDRELFLYPIIFINGHGNISFDDAEVRALRSYIEHGGFIFANDDFGMNESFRREMKKVFPESGFVELPVTHELYRSPYQFPAGLPKIHEHDGGPPKGYGIFHRGRLAVFYAFDADIADGWADPEVHKTPEAKRREALHMGVNIILYGLTH